MSFSGTNIYAQSKDLIKSTFDGVLLYLLGNWAGTYTPKHEYLNDEVIITTEESVSDIL